MFQFFNSVASIFYTAVNFIKNSLEMVVNVVINAGRSVVWLIACLSYLPPWLVAFVVVPISLAVIFQIINKGS